VLRWQRRGGLLLLLLLRLVLLLWSMLWLLLLLLLLFQLPLLQLPLLSLLRELWCLPIHVTGVLRRSLLAWPPHSLQLLLNWVHWRLELAPKH
jgi:hypothetical protein